MQGANCQGRTLVVLFSTMSAASGSQGLPDFPNKGHPFYTSHDITMATMADCCPVGSQ